MLDNNIVQHIARLARLELSEAEQIKMQKDLSSILDYIDQLNKVKTDNIDLKQTSPGLANVLREDVPLPEKREVVETLLSQFPKKHGNYIKVKEVLG